MEKEDEKIYIPANVKAESYIFDGFGVSELIKSVITSLIISVIWVVVYFINHNLSFMALAIMITIAVSIIIFMKDQTNQSVVDYVKNVIKFGKSQKVYIYNNEKSVKEWENELIEFDKNEFGNEYNSRIY